MRFIVSYTKEKSDQLKMCLSEIQSVDIKFASGKKEFIVPGHVYETSEDCVELLDDCKSQVELIILDGENNIKFYKLKHQLMSVGVPEKVAMRCTKNSFSEEDQDEASLVEHECIEVINRNVIYLIVKEDDDDYCLVTKEKTKLDDYATDILAGNFDEDEGDDEGYNTRHLCLVYVIKNKILYTAELSAKYEKVYGAKKNS